MASIFGWPLVAMVGAMSLAGSVQAACNVNRLISHPILGDILVKQNGNVGDVLQSRSLTGTTRNVLSCGQGVARFRSGWSPLPGWVQNGETFQTNLAGIGIRVTHQSGSDLGPGPGRNFPYDFTRTFAVPAQLDDSGVITVEFVRTAATLVAGALTNGDFALQGSDQNIAYRRLQSAGITFRLAACSIRMADLNQTVALGSHSSSDIDRDGATRWVGFNLQSEDCDASLLQDAHFQFSGAADANETDLFAVTGGARGLGIELRTGTAAGAGTQLLPNRPLVLTTLATGEDYNFSARYRRTRAAAIQPGNAGAQLRVTVTFQ